ncbi:efflux RND transporter periplasmic adaptor subunit [Castellaniella sp. S9]|uniref:efflux RND transporter periplasmic adaptor subunit n=1 Tax=Castellaniella sp. S9 TaxID=2993652 RepID=UPI003FA4397C
MPEIHMVGSTMRPGARRLSWILGTAIVLAGLAVGVWLYKGNGNAGGPSGFPGRGGMSTPVRVALAQDGAVARLLDAIGTVTSSGTVTVRPRVDGLLESVDFQDGQTVRAGDVLARIDPEPFRIQLDQAQGQQAQHAAQLANAQRDLERYERLFKQDSVARQQLDTARAQVLELQGQARTDQAAVDDAKRQLGYTRILAPIDGRLGLRKVDAGNMVSASDTDGLVVITRSRPIDVVFAVPQVRLEELMAGQAAGGGLVVEARSREGDRVLARGVLAAIDNQIDVSTGTVSLKARFANEDDALFPNQFVNVRLYLGQQHGILVPVRAVQRGSIGAFVYRIDAQQRAHVVPVRTGASDGERVIIEDGLQAGDQVVVDGTDRLREDSPVEIVTGDPQAPAGVPAR